MFISMEFPVWVESLRTTHFTLAHNVHKGSMSTSQPYLLSDHALFPQRGSEPLGQLKAPVDLSLHLKLSRCEVKLHQGGKTSSHRVIKTLSDKKMKRRVQAKYWKLQAKGEICRVGLTHIPASACQQLKASAQLKLLVCGIVLHRLLKKHLSNLNCSRRKLSGGHIPVPSPALVLSKDRNISEFGGKCLSPRRNSDFIWAHPMFLL